MLSSESSLLSNHNFVILLTRPHEEEARWKYCSYHDGIRRLCDMDVYDRDRLGGVEHPAKRVYLKLLPRTTDTETRLAAVLRLYEADPSDEANTRWHQERRDVGDADLADWSTQCGGSDADGLIDDLENDKEVVDYPFVRERQTHSLGD